MHICCQSTLQEYHFTCFHFHVIKLVKSLINFKQPLKNSKTVAFLQAGMGCIDVLKKLTQLTGNIFRKVQAIFSQRYKQIQ